MCPYENGHDNLVPSPGLGNGVFAHSALREISVLSFAASTPGFS